MDSTLALLARHRAGDSAALDELLRRHYSRVERIVRVRMGGKLRARESLADVVQDVMIRVVESVDRYEPRSDAHWIDWVARLVQNELSNHARHHGAKKRGGGSAGTQHSDEAVFEVAADTTAVHSKASKRELAALVDDCLSELSEAHREVILLRDYAGADFRTVAERMGRPSAEACQELHRRARRELEKRFRERS